MQLLECQAAGMPLVTTDLPPMNEYQPLATIPVIGSEIIAYGSGQPIAAPLMTGDALARVLEGLLGSDITEASRRARAYVESQHSWTRAASLLKASLAAV